MLGMLLHYVVVILFSRYFAAILFAFIFMKLFSPLHVCKERRKRKTYNLQDRQRA